MIKKMKITAGILTVLFCILIGCRQEEKQGESLLLLPARGVAGEASFSGNEQMDLEAAASASGQREQTGSVPVTEFVVHICGAVQNPGVYRLPRESRVYEAVEAAGGFLEEAAQDYLNQADLLQDGMKLYVPTLTEIQDAGSETDWKVQPGQSQQEGNGLVNINQAGEALLCTLPGIGASKAKSIIAYREKNGAFRTIEDITNVEGIKEGLFQKIQSSITV